MTGCAIEQPAARHEPDRRNRRVAVNRDRWELRLQVLTHPGDLERDRAAVEPVHNASIARAKRAEPIEDAGPGLRVDVTDVDRWADLAGRDAAVVPTRNVKA